MQGRTLALSCSGELAGDELRLILRPKEMPGEERLTMRRVRSGSPLDRFAENAAPEAVTAWVKANAIRLASLDPNADFSDLTPLIPRLKDARVVAMGEATHGTREFQQIKVRMFRFLVEKLGFTVFGIEANWPDVLTVNEYVQGASVDPGPALGALWWRTDEMFALLRWMRDYNRDPAHSRKLRFYGFDMMVPGPAGSNVLAYLRRVDPALVDGTGRVFGLLGTSGENREYEAATAEVKRGTAEELAKLLRRFDDRKADWVRKSSLREWAMARQHLTIVKQAEVKIGDPGERGKIYRDRAMAENVRWILEQEPPGTKMMLWAHNGHVAKAAPESASDGMPMGGHLAGFFGDALVSCGFVFGEGGFRAVDQAGGGIREFRVGPPPGGSLDATLGGVGLGQFVIDLRGAPAWFAGSHYSRQIGGGYAEATPGVWMRRMRAAREFDLVIYVGRSSGSR